MNIKRQYIVDEHDRRVAVQIDIGTFEKIEDALENFALFSRMKEVDDDGDIAVQDGELFIKTIVL